MEAMTVTELPVVNVTLQVTLLIIILTAALLSNASVIINISCDKLKLKMIHFILIRHVCITDFIGALFILPVPLVVVAKGEWKYNPIICSTISTTTAACWTMHLIAVAMYRADRVLAVWLPTGKYPILSVRNVNIILVTTWLIAITGSYTATIIFGHVFQPALALCIPDVPIIFFIVIFSGYCIGLISLTTGYLCAFVRKRRKKRRKSTHKFVLNTPFEPDEPVDLDEIEWRSSEPNRPRSLSDQIKSSPIPEKIFQHRRGLSETYYTQNSLSSNSDSTLSYERLEDDSDKLTHSISLDETNYHQQRTCKIVLSKSWDCSDLKMVSIGICLTEQIYNEQTASHSQLSLKMPNVIEKPIILKKPNRNYKSKSSARRALASYAVSVGHLLLYLPAMFVIGLNRGSLPPGAALICGLVIYCEFIIQPVALLIVSQRLRLEVFSMYKWWKR